MDFGLFFNGAAATFDYRISENKSYNTQIEQILELECFRTTGWVSDLYQRQSTLPRKRVVAEEPVGLEEFEARLDASRARGLKSSAQTSRKTRKC